MPKPKRYFEYSEKKSFGGKQRHDDGGGGEHNPSRERRGVLSEEVMSYYRQVSATLETGFDEDNPEVKDQFLANVFSSLKDECVSVSQNQTVSKILEVLLSHSPASHMRPVFCKFCKELTIVVFDAFASHVFQALIQYLPLMFVQKDEEDDEEMIKQVKESAQVLFSFMESHLRDIMTHVYGSHVLRTLLEVLGGVVVTDDIVRSRVSRSQSMKKVADRPEVDSGVLKSFSEEQKSWFETLSQKLIKLCNYEDHLSDNNYSPVLQTVLLILSKTSPSEYDKLVDTILEKTCMLANQEDIPADDIVNRLPLLVQDNIGSFVVELIISLSSGPRFEELYNLLFKGKLLFFAVHPFANYVLQKMLSTISEKKLMQNILDDISKYIEDILAVNHCGIVTKLAEACQRTGVGQEQFLQVLMSAFHCYEPESKRTKIVPLVASFQTYEVFYKAAEDSKEEGASALLKTVSYHGSMILQQLLQFSKPVTVVMSVLELSAAELLFLACNHKGSHVVDVFFQSPTVKDKHKDTLVKKLVGLYINMACNKVGSRCLENIWKLVSIPLRVLIAEDLSKYNERLEGDFSGRFIFNNFALHKFVTRRKEWREIQGANSKKKQLLKGILEGKQPKKMKEKKKPSSQLAVEETENPTDFVDESNEKNPSQSLDGPQQKKKKEKAAVCEAVIDRLPTSGVLDESSNVDNDDNKKSRNRKKEKKRVVRTADKASDSDTVPVKKKRKRDQGESVGDEEEVIVSKKKKKKQKNVSGSSIKKNTNTERVKKKKRDQEKSIEDEEEVIVPKKKKKKQKDVHE
ncbi:nucleolar protein 9 [Aplysia californica]|uniref:Nucleolar protein 9 n=1 Tax=Aplysia californica TaxID=6500 RepID=A0ABM0JUW3_APLCA|nr:nucleolar protein 9 [Aplysia californica]